jgi:hypothetical protein
MAAHAEGRTMNAIRIRTTLESETLYLPELKPLIGRAVEIIVLEDAPAAPQVRPGTGDWEEFARASQALRDSGYDFNAWREQREFDQRYEEEQFKDDPA